MIESILTTDYLQWDNFLWIFAVLSFFIFLRYFLLSAVFHHAFRTSLQSVLGNRDLVKVKLDRTQAKKEIWYSFISSVIFAFIAIAMIIGWQRGVVKIYTEVNSTYPGWYIPLSVLLILFLHDTYYYWLHRLFHLKSVYKKVHLVHHKSIRTSAFTSFSFHPFESVAQAIALPMTLLIIPLHLYAFLGLLIFMTLSAIINHLGVEVYPSGKVGAWMGKWFIGATHHDQHHRKFLVNYGLYFTFWDRWMGTEANDFEENFKKAVQN
jgi:sterol desaturase/sphingolipid hydroxylase (fatty acid hydroxylase superfamily)